MVGLTGPRTCAFRKRDGQLCGAPPLRDGPYCFWHDPDHAAEAAEARRLGGLRRRREKTLEGAYDLGGLGSVAAIRRFVEIAALDVLGLDNSIPRANAIARLALVAAKLLEVGEVEERVEALEAAVRARPPSAQSALAEPAAAIEFVERAS